MIASPSGSSSLGVVGGTALERREDALRGGGTSRIHARQAVVGGGPPSLAGRVG